MTELTVLPVEVSELANKVSLTKQEEVKTVLDQIFKGTSDWQKQIDALEVNSIEDKLSIALADVARKNVKNARLSAERVLKEKREAVQQLKAEYDFEDKMWLKALQIVQLSFKNIEEKAEWKANFVKRYEAEQKELRTQTRIALVDKYAEINRSEFEIMSDSVFEIFLAGLKKSFEEKQLAEKLAKEKAELETKQRLLREERNNRLRPYFSFMTEEEDDTDLGVISQEEYIALGLKLKARKDDDEKEKLRLKHEAEQAELKLQEEREENQRKADEAKRLADEHLAKIQEENRIKNEQAELLRREAQSKIDESNRKKALAEFEERKKNEALQNERHELIYPYWHYLNNTDIPEGTKPFNLHLLSFDGFKNLLNIANQRQEEYRKQQAIEDEERKIREKISSVSPEEYAYLVQCKEVLLLLVEQRKITNSDIDKAIEQLKK